MTYPEDTLLIPAEGDDKAGLSIEWLNVPVCAAHGRPARPEICYAQDSALRSTLWLTLARYTVFIPSVYRKLMNRNRGIRANWPVCDLCERAAGQRGIGALAIAIGGVLCLVLGMKFAGTGAAWPFALLAFACIPAAVAMTARSLPGSPRADMKKRIVIARHTHPNFYDEASRQIRLRGYSGYNRS